MRNLMCGIRDAAPVGHSNETILVRTPTFVRLGSFPPLFNCACARVRMKVGIHVVQSFV